MRLEVQEADTGSDMNKRMCVYFRLVQAMMNGVIVGPDRHGIVVATTVRHGP